MSMNIRPICSALLRNRTGAVLVAIQIAIALAVMVNAVYIAKQRYDRVGKPTGIDIGNIVVVSSSGFSEGYDYVAALREDLTYIRGVGEVRAATAVNAVPLSENGSATGLSNRPDDRTGGVTGSYLEVDEQGIDALGLHLVAGRGFRAEDIQPPVVNGQATSFVPQVILTRAMADEIFPHDNPLGKTIYTEFGQGATVIGIVGRMQGPWPESSFLENVFLLPRLPFSFSSAIYYIVRTQPGRRDAVAQIIESHLSTSNPNRLIDWVRPLQSFKDRSYASDHNMEIFLVTVTTALLGISCLGIFGLATFTVSTRTKQIGTRRAVGARRGDILSYFMIENALITTSGMVVGCALALAVGYWLSREYQLPRLDLYYLIAGIPVLWTIGQLAVWQPARRASAVSPSVATRTV
jgi:putative ABC transport system permease protein